MSPDEELALVRQALTSGITGCVEWHPGEGERIRKSRWLQGLTPEGIQRDIVEFVSRGGAVKQMKERRPEYSHRKFWYRIIVPYPDLFRIGLFVEVELFDPDPDCPVVLLLNAHEQK